jgi:hypothetical protein
MTARKIHNLVLPSDTFQPLSDSGGKGETLVQDVGDHGSQENQKAGKCQIHRHIPVLSADREHRINRRVYPNYTSAARQLIRFRSL